MISRATVAENLATRLAGSGEERAAAVRQAAAWLVANGRSRQAGYLARDVAVALERRGYLLVRIVTARDLSAESLRNVEKYVRDLTCAKDLELISEVDPSLVGGVLIETPSGWLDATVEHKLQKFVEGVI